MNMSKQQAAGTPLPFIIRPSSSSSDHSKAPAPPHTHHPLRHHDVNSSLPSSSRTPPMIGRLSYNHLKPPHDQAFHHIRPSDHHHDTLIAASGKENVKSWLDSTSPTSVLNNMYSNQSQCTVAPTADPQEIFNTLPCRECDPPTPSPICSPSPSSPIINAHPRSRRSSKSPLESVFISEKALRSTVNTQVQSNALNMETSIDVQTPDSPTGSSLSSSSEGGRLLALLASKLLSYKLDKSRRFSRYASFQDRDQRSGPIDEKHVMEDRGMKPAVEESDISMHQGADQPFHTLVQGGSSASVWGTHSRTMTNASDAASDVMSSLGSANGRTLSMEFDAILAAAAYHHPENVVAPPSASLGSGSQLQSVSMPEIQEEHSFGRETTANPSSNIRALVRIDGSAAYSTDDEASRITNALTVMRQDAIGDQGESTDILSENSIAGGAESPQSNNSSNGMLMQLVPTTVSRAAGSTTTNTSLAASSSCSSSNDGDRPNSLAMVLVHSPVTAAATGSPSPSTATAESHVTAGKMVCVSHNRIQTMQNLPARQALERVKRERILAQALAYENAKSSKCNNRYKKEESEINAWENQQRIKASIRMKKVEMKLEQKRAKAMEKMENELALAHKRAEEKKASAEAVRAAKAARVAQEAECIRRSRKAPPVVGVGCFRDF